MIQAYTTKANMAYTSHHSHCEFLSSQTLSYKTTYITLSAKKYGVLGQSATLLSLSTEEQYAQYETLNSVYAQCHQILTTLVDNLLRLTLRPTVIISQEDKIFLHC